MIVTGALGTGGLERITAFVGNFFVQQSWKVVIVTLLQRPSPDAHFQQLSDEITILPFQGKNDPTDRKYRSILEWRRMIKKATRTYRPDSILAMTFKIASMVCLFAPKYANRVTVREINDPKAKGRNPMIRLLTELLCRKVKNIIFQTEYERSCYHRNIRAKGVVISNPLSIQVKEHGTYSSERVFSLSRLDLKQKRTDILIKGFELFHASHPSYTLEIYGRGPNEPEIKQMILESSCPESIKVLPPVSDVHRLVIDCRCFVMTSDFEGMSNALLECYSLGIPCVSSNWPGVEDIITHGQDGLLYKRQDVVELAKAISAFADNTELCQTITKKAIEGSERFSESKILKRYYETIGFENRDR